jgi:hypothetical protein
MTGSAKQSRSRKARAGLLPPSPNGYGGQVVASAPRNDVDGHGVSPMTTSSRPPRRDPYAVRSRFGNVADAFLDNPRQGLWVPARRPGRPGWVARIHFSNSNLCTDMVSRSRDGIRPSFANSSAPKKIEGARDPQERAQGRPGARCTRGLVCKGSKQKRTRAYRFSGSSPAFPAQWFYSLFRALPGETIACLSPSFPGSASLSRT